MKKILWVSPFAPYDRVPHAGGKAENYFLKGVHSSKRFHLDVITCYRHREKADLDLDEYGIPNRQMDLEPNKAMLVLKKLANAESALNPWNRNGCILQNRTEYLLKILLRNICRKTAARILLCLSGQRQCFSTSILKNSFRMQKF